jgi:uncharacterized protein (DUF1330 family)
MSAFLIASVTAQDLDWVAEYVVKVPPIVRSYGGNYLAVSQIPPNVELVEGTAPTPDGFAIVTFPSMEALKSFLEAPEYAPYRKARIAATKSDVFAFENDDNAPQFLGQ